MKGSDETTASVQMTLGQKARVEAADTARIQARAEAAAKVAEGAERRAAVVQQLAELDAVLAADIAAAEESTSRAALTAAGYTVPDDYMTTKVDPATVGTALDQLPKVAVIPGASVTLTVSFGPGR